MGRVIGGENVGQASEGEPMRSGRCGGPPGASRNIDLSGLLWTIHEYDGVPRKKGVEVGS